MVSSGKFPYVESQTIMRSVMKGARNTSTFSLEIPSNENAAANGLVGFQEVVGNINATAELIAESTSPDSNLQDDGQQGAVSVLEPPKIFEVYGIYDIETHEWVGGNRSGEVVGWLTDRALLVLSKGVLSVVDVSGSSTEIEIPLSEALPQKAAISDDTKRLAIVDKRQQLHVFEMANRQLKFLKSFDLTLANSGTISDIQFSSSSRQIKVVTTENESYYASSQSCIGCSVDVNLPNKVLLPRDSVELIDIENGRRRIYRNVVDSTEDYAVLATDNSISLRSFETGDLSVSSVPFASESVFSKPELGRIITISYPSTGVNISRQPKVETWDIKTGVPIAPTVFLSRNSTVVGFDVSDKSTRVFSVDESKQLRYIDIPLYAELDEKQPISKTLDWAEAFAGSVIRGSTGALHELNLAERKKSLNSTIQLGDEQWQELRAWAENTRSVKFWPGCNEVSRSEEQLASVPTNKREARDNRYGDYLVSEGYQFPEGFLLRLNSQSDHWVMIDSRLSSPLPMVELERSKEHITLHDEIRNLEYQIQKLESRVLVRPHSQQPGSWQSWNEVTRIPVAR